jgi:hypothetical protein
MRIYTQFLTRACSLFCVQAGARALFSQCKDLALASEPDLALSRLQYLQHLHMSHVQHLLVDQSVQPSASLCASWTLLEQAKLLTEDAAQQQASEEVHAAWWRQGLGKVCHTLVVTVCQICWRFACEVWAGVSAFCNVNWFHTFSRGDEH